jgi:hypothetical protein
MDEERFRQQLDIVKPEALANVPVTVIGAGAIGSFTVLTLAKMGMRNITVFDFDSVEEHNLPNQFYRLCDLGKPKAEALKKIVLEFEGIEITARNEKYKGQRLRGIVIVSVDSMDVRTNIWRFIRGNPEVTFFIDSRMGAEVMQVFSLNPSDLSQCAEYEKNLFPSSEAFRERCTAKTIMYTVLTASSLISNQVKKFLMGETVKREITFDMKTMTFIV